MPRKSALAELLADHRQQEAAEEASAASSTGSASPLSFAASAASQNAVDPTPAPRISRYSPPRIAPPMSSSRRRPDQQEAKHRMERVYEEVSRRKSQAIGAPSSETDSTATPPASDAPMSSIAVDIDRLQQNTTPTGSEEKHRAGFTPKAGQQDAAGVQEDPFHLAAPRSKDRKRPRVGVKRVGFTTPPLPIVSGSSSSRTVENGDRRVETFSGAGIRHQGDDAFAEPIPKERRRRKKRDKKSRKRSSSGDDKGTNLLDVDDATVEYIDAVLVKPDPQVFNKYTRFFLDPKLETLYQDFTAVFWFGRARWHVACWIIVHLFVNLLYLVLPSYGFRGMDQFLLSYDSLPTIFQWIYIPIALPFAVLPNKWNPFQTRWRSWVCLIIIFFNLTFQVWLADASRLAINAFTDVVNDNVACDAENPELLATFAGFAGSSSGSSDALSNATIQTSLAYLNDEQRDLAVNVTHMCSDALVQTLVGFSSLFSFLFVISIRLEFIQMVVVGVTGAAIYAIVVSAFGLQLQWLITFAFGMAVVLLLILSYSTDRTNRRSFLSNFLVEKENESLKSSLKQAEAALQNDAAHADEERAVARVMAAPEMRHLEMVHIPFADLTFIQAIGRGSMGDVIKARYFGTIVVCKRMRREHIVGSESHRNRSGNRQESNGDSALSSFRDEIELMSCLRHPNIVQFIGASWDNASNLCIVMEYLENGDMHSVLHSGLGKNFTWADPLLKMAIDAVQGMLYLHSQERPVVHRDLKSVNILCSATFGCKVGDFGLSRRYKKGVDALTTLVGTPFWLAPEIIRSERYGPEADVYSFGIVLTELETRRTPYHDQEETGLRVLMRVAHKGLRPSLPPSCLPERRRLIEDCLRDIPARRPTFAQVLSRLQGPVLQEIEGHVAAQPDLERRVLLRRHQERKSL